jgi:predicted PurR-regulated permease PerM
MSLENTLSKPESSPAEEKNTQTIKWSGESVIMTLVILALAYAVWQLWSVVLLIFAAIVIASFVTGVSRTVSDRRTLRIIATIAVYVSVLIIIAGLLYLLVPALVKEVTQIIENMPQKQGAITQALATIKGLGINMKDGGDIVTRLQTSISQFSQAGVFQTMSTAFGGVVNFVLVIILSLYLSLEDRGVERSLRAVLPIRYEERAIGLWLRIEEKISQWFRGQLISASIMGALTYLGLWIFGVPYAFLFSALAAILGLVPFGVGVAGILTAGMAFLTGGFKLAIFVILWFLLLQQIEQYVLQPLIVRRSTGIPSTLVLLSLMICGSLWGFIGIILAIPVAVLGMELVKDYGRRKEGEKEEEMSEGIITEEKE